MDRSKLGLLLAILACGPGVGNESPIALPADVTLRVGEQGVTEGVTILFVKVNEDSRCPSNVQCVWAGNAAVELRLTGASGPPVTRVLNSGSDPRVIEEFGLRITMKELSPVPREGDAEPKGYNVTLRVEKP